jgi:hypothetical protein
VHFLVLLYLRLYLLRSRIYNIMRPLSFPPGALRRLLLRHKIATMPELKQALGTEVALTVFRKLKALDYLASYSHRGSYYTLREIARFDPDGLWSHSAVWFSLQGTLLATAEHFVNASPQGLFADELSHSLHVGVHDALRHLVEQRRIARQSVAGLYLYLSTDPTTRRRQLLMRSSAQTLPMVNHASRLRISPEELKAAIVLFYSLLDERQRRLYAGLESLKLGHGGDQHLAKLLGIDPHTVARGRQELSAQELEFDRVRRAGGGRQPVEKKHHN